jgi:hypothetical protein
METIETIEIAGARQFFEILQIFKRKSMMSKSFGHLQNCSGWPDGQFLLDRPKFE